MFFRNATLFRLPNGLGIDAESLAQRLAAMPFRACSGTEKETIGWITPTPTGLHAHSVGGNILIALKQESKVLPTSVIKRFAKERAQKIEDQEGRKVGRKEMRQLQEQCADELLGRAFTSEKTTFAWIDPAGGWLVVDAATPARAEGLLEFLRKTIPDLLKVDRVNFSQSPSAVMTGWIATGEPPALFTIDQDLELCTAEKGKVRYTKHTLEGDEIRQHVASGKTVARLALTWNDRLSFILTDQFSLRTISFLDIVKEKASDQATSEEEVFDAEFAIMAGELAAMLKDLVPAIGEVAAQ